MDEKSIARIIHSLNNNRVKKFIDRELKIQKHIIDLEEFVIFAYWVMRSKPDIYDEYKLLKEKKNV